MPRFEEFGWGELFSMIAVTISFATICISIFGRSKQDTKNEQRMFDKLDSLGASSNEIRDDVRTISKQVSDYGIRLAKNETEVKLLKEKIDRIETQCNDRFISLHSLGGTD